MPFYELTNDEWERDLEEARRSLLYDPIKARQLNSTGTGFKTLWKPGFGWVEQGTGGPGTFRRSFSTASFEDTVKQEAEAIRRKRLHPSMDTLFGGFPGRGF